MTLRSICPGCGGVVPPRKAPGPVKIFCSKKCGRRARERLASIERARRAKLPAPAKTFAAAYRQAVAHGCDPLEERDAFYECAHGHLPGDTAAACECWTSGVRA